MPCLALLSLRISFSLSFSPFLSLILPVTEDCCNIALSYLPLTTNHVTAQEILKAPINVLVFCTGESKWLHHDMPSPLHFNTTCLAIAI